MGIATASRRGRDLAFLWSWANFPSSLCGAFSLSHGTWKSQRPHRESGKGLGGSSSSLDISDAFHVACGQTRCVLRVGGLGTVSGSSRGPALFGLWRHLQGGGKEGEATSAPCSGLGHQGGGAGNSPRAQPNLFTVPACSQPVLCSSLVNPPVLYSFLLAIAFFFPL